MVESIDAFPREAARALRGFCFDLDDTLLDGGALTEPAYSSLFRLAESGLDLYGVTGRPAGWAEVIARLFPVRAVIAENGAVAFRRRGDRILRSDSADPQLRAVRTRALEALVAETQARFPELVLSDDVGARLTDRTFDIGEHERVPPERVGEVSDFLRERGARVFASSVHLHLTFDQADKASGALRVLCEDSGLDSTAARRAYAFIGDSENDAACFAAFPFSIGVKNLRGRPTLAPRYRTLHEKGQGFAEAAAVLVRLRR